MSVDLSDEASAKAEAPFDRSRKLVEGWARKLTMEIWKDGGDLKNLMISHQATHPRCHSRQINLATE